MKTSKNTKLKIINTERIKTKYTSKAELKKDLTRGANLILLNSSYLKKAA